MQKRPVNGVDLGARRLNGRSKASLIGERHRGLMGEYAAANVNYGVSAFLG